MRTVKPRVIFNLLPKVEPKDRLVTIPMPHGPYGNEDGWGITLLEMFVLIALGRHVSAKKVFEFGTWRGGTTRALWHGLPGVLIDTIDIAPQADFEDYPGVIQLTGDSKSLMPDTADLVWIDGGHDLETFQNDTRLAHAMNPKCIVWHDCGNPAYPWITETLQKDCFRVASTQLAVWPISLIEASR